MSETKEEISWFKWLLLYAFPPIGIILLGIGAIVTVALLKEEPEKKEPEKSLPFVEYLEVQPGAATVVIESQGAVQARNETVLLAEVSGRIVDVSPALFSGGFFKKGDVLAEIEDLDYRANLAAAQLRLAEAKLALDQEKEFSAQALEDWNALDRPGQPSELVLRKPQLERAQALYDSAEIAVSIAERDLERVKVRAPYDGRVRQKLVDVGQIVNARMSQVARIYSTDTAEIPLSLSLDELSYLELPESYSNSSEPDEVSTVTIELQQGTNIHTWKGTIDRVEGAMDPLTRQSNVVARIANPYAKSDGKEKPPLKVGMFVKARIEGKTVDDAYSIPRLALYEGDVVYLIDSENRIRFKEVEVYRADTTRAIITGGLNPGDRICLTPLEYAVDGMSVKTESDEEENEESDEESEDSRSEES